ncbi:hypothetical protein [Intrasporangium sp.]|uniref:hypothetical protein n=1 Tax=Intrasporangium sp. TaxID=1925024 RepID=UPI0032221280
MSVPATPIPHQDPPQPPQPATDLQAHETSRVVQELIALSSNTSRGLNHDAPATSSIADATDVDYWYRLGLRNAYAQAAGLLLAPALGEGPFTIAERLTASLDAGITDPHRLHTAACGHQTPARPVPGLEWVGPRQFAACHGVVTVADRQFGARWGARGEQRITLRPDPVSGRGVLFAYDPTWDEYAVLATGVTPAAVEAAFADATQIDIHLDPARFAQLVHAHQTDPHAARAVPEREAGPELGVRL